MKFSLLIFTLTLFVLNACVGQLSGDPAPGRSPGPPEHKITSSQTVSDYSTITASTLYAHAKDISQPNTFNISTNEDIRFNEPLQPSDSFKNSRHSEHVSKSHESTASTHHGLIEKAGKTTSEIGVHVTILLLLNS